MILMWRLMKSLRKLWLKSKKLRLLKKPRQMKRNTLKIKASDSFKIALEFEVFSLTNWKFLIKVHLPNNFFTPLKTEMQSFFPWYFWCVFLVWTFNSQWNEWISIPQFKAVTEKRCSRTFCALNLWHRRRKKKG